MNLKDQPTRASQRIGVKLVMTFSWWALKTVGLESGI